MVAFSNFITTEEELGKVEISALRFGVTAIEGDREWEVREKILFPLFALSLFHFYSPQCVRPFAIHYGDFNMAIMRTKTLAHPAKRLQRRYTTGKDGFPLSVGAQ